MPYNPIDRAAGAVPARSLGLYLGASMALADATGCTTRGWQVHGLAKLSGRLSQVAAHVAGLLQGSPTGTRLVVGVADDDHPAVKLLRQAVPDLMLVIVGRNGQTRRTNEGVWCVPAASLKGAVVAARESSKLKIAGCEAATAFSLATNRLHGPTSEQLPADDDLILAVSVALWGSISEIIERRWPKLKIA